MEEEISQPHTHPALSKAGSEQEWKGYARMWVWRAQSQSQATNHHHPTLLFSFLSDWVVVWAGLREIVSPLVGSRAETKKSNVGPGARNYSLFSKGTRPGPTLTFLSLPRPGSTPTGPPPGFNGKDYRRWPSGFFFFVRARPA
jgi:hypothetical protein